MILGTLREIEATKMFSSCKAEYRSSWSRSGESPVARSLVERKSMTPLRSRPLRPFLLVV